MTTYRTLPQGEIIPPNAEYRTPAGFWRQTQNPGLKHETASMNYRVPVIGDPDNVEEGTTIGDTRYMKEEGQWYRLLKFGDVIPKHSQCKSNSEAKWRESRMVGQYLYASKNTYRVPCDPPPPPTDERVAVIGDTRYMKEEGQWYRLLDIWDLIPQDTEFLNGGKWCKTERVGEKVEDYDFQYRVPCDPPMRATPPPCEYQRLIKERDQLLVRYQRCINERDQLHLQYQSLKAEHLKALEVIENIRDALTAKDA